MHGLSVFWMYRSQFLIAGQFGPIIQHTLELCLSLRCPRVVCLNNRVIFSSVQKKKAGRYSATFHRGHSSASFIWFLAVCSFATSMQCAAIFPDFLEFSALPWSHHLYSECLIGWSWKTFLSTACYIFAFPPRYHKKWLNFLCCRSKMAFGPSFLSLYLDITSLVVLNHPYLISSSRIDLMVHIYLKL